MKATLRFSLPEEQIEFDCAVKGIEYKIALQEVKEFFYKDRPDGETDKEYIQALSDTFYTAVDGLDLS